MFVLLLPLPLAAFFIFFLFFVEHQNCAQVPVPCWLFSSLSLHTAGVAGKHLRGDSSHCSVSAPYSSSAVCVSSKAAVVAFPFAWVMVSLMGCQQHLILGPTNKVLEELS